MHDINFHIVFCVRLKTKKVTTTINNQTTRNFGKRKSVTLQKPGHWSKTSFMRRARKQTRAGPTNRRKKSRLPLYFLQFLDLLIAGIINLKTAVSVWSSVFDFRMVNIRQVLAWCIFLARSFFGVKNFLACSFFGVMGRQAYRFQNVFGVMFFLRWLENWAFW